MTMALGRSDAALSAHARAPVVAPGVPQSRGQSREMHPRKDALTRTQRTEKYQAVGQEMDRRPSAIIGGTLAGPGLEALLIPHRAQKPAVPLGQALPF